MPSGNWEASQLQAVVFLRKAISVADVFTAITGDGPETQEDRPKEGVRVQTGPFLGGSLQVVLNPVRVDIILSPAGGAELIFAPQTLGDFETKLEEFVSVVRKWLPNCGLPTLRLSLVAKALAPADSTDAAYEILKANLKSVIIRPGEMRDLTFRVNWRAKSACMPEGYLNRVTTWAAVAFRRQAGQLGLPMVPVGETHHAYREIDVNTPAEHAEELPAEQLLAIYNELVDIVVSTAKAGEQPL